MLGKRADPPRDAVAFAQQDREKHFPLKLARATDLAVALEKLYPETPMPRDSRGRPLPHLQTPREVLVSADAATNTLIIEAPAERKQSFAALVEQLDAHAALEGHAGQRQERAHLAGGRRRVRAEQHDIGEALARPLGWERLREIFSLIVGTISERHQSFVRSTGLFSAHQRKNQMRPPRNTSVAAVAAHSLSRTSRKSSVCNIQWIDHNDQSIFPGCKYH